MMKQGNGTNKILKFTVIALGVMILILGILLVFQQQVGAVSLEISDELVEYESYYVLIADESDSILWESVYEGAIKAGQESNAYVEFIESGDGMEFTIQEKLRIAIDSGVDGIIVCSDGEAETTELIDEAISKEIAVVTVLNDATDSLRKSYIGVNNYTLGETYGTIIWEYLTEVREESDCVISILMDASGENTGKNTTYLGLKEYLDNMTLSQGWSGQITIESVSINREETFVAEETIGDIIVAQETDILVCLNAVDTETAYRTVVDYNLVGTVQILGYYESEVILEAIEKDIIYSTITINGEEAGSQCIEALNEYRETGYVNGYLTVEIEVLNQSNVTTYLEKYAEVSEVENE